MTQIHVELKDGEFTLTYDANDKRSRVRAYKMLNGLFWDLWMGDTEEAKRYRRQLYKKVGGLLYRFFTNSWIARLIKKIEDLIW